MAAGLIVSYPADLPAPQTAPLSPTERRLLSEIAGPMQARGIQRDYHAVQRATWVLTAEQARRWDDWWRDTLVRGGLWFCADWPLLSGRLDNVYRFHAAPTWRFLRGGPKGWGMHHVASELEVRGRGELPRSGYSTFVTSRVYPVVAEDELAVTHGFTGADYTQMPLDLLDIAFALDGGNIRIPFIDYSIEPESLDMAFALAGGEIREPLIAYDIPPESLDIAFALDAGDLRVVLIDYDEWTPEALDITFALDGGSLS